MAWCRLATSYYLSQCWPQFLLTYCVTLTRHGAMLTHWGKVKMTAIRQTAFLNGLFHENIISIWFNCLWILFLVIQWRKSAMIPIKPCRLTRYDTLPEPLITEFINGYVSQCLGGLSDGWSIASLIHWRLLWVVAVFSYLISYLICRHFEMCEI